MISTTTAISCRQPIATQFTGGIAIALLAIAALFVAPTVLRADPPLPGAVFITDSGCTGVNLNIYGSKGDVYLDGGPAHPGAASLPDGNYYVKVTDPSGDCVLGTSVGASDQQPFKVSNGTAACIQLCAVLINGPTGTGAIGSCPASVDSTCGYNDTTNPGGEYKVWVSSVSTFDDNSTKTDNFKIREGAGGPGSTATLCVDKFYDANANGIWDDNEVEITGWQFTVFGTVGFDTIQIPHTTTPWCNAVVDPDTFTVTELLPVPPPIWINTTTNPVTVTVHADEEGDVIFGNFCEGAGGGLTLGFWSNKNGQSLETAASFTLLNGLYLRTATGGNEDFYSSLANNKTALANWLLAANATNMAYMLSAQLATMELNVSYYGVSNKFGAGVNGNSLIYAPGLVPFQSTINSTPGVISGVNNLGAITINDLMTAANYELGLHGTTKDGSPYRAYQEALKTALDNANNNLNFIESSPTQCGPLNFPAN